MVKVKSLMKVVPMLAVFAITFVGCEKKNNGEVIVKENTKLPEQNSNLVDVEVYADTLLKLIYQSGAAKPTFSPGDIVVGSKGEGYLHKVVSEELRGDTVILHTKRAALTDALERGSIDTTFILQPSSKMLKAIRSDTTFKENNRPYRIKTSSKQPILSSTESGFILDWPDLDIELLSASEVVASLHIDQLSYHSNSNFDFAFDIDNSQAVTFRCIVHGADTLYFTGVSLSVEKNISLLDKSISLLGSPLPLVTATILIPTPLGFPLPVVVNLDFDPCLGFSAEATLSQNMTLTNEFTLALKDSVGAEYSEGSWHNVWVNELGGNGSLVLSTSSPTVTAELQAYLKGTLDLKLYNSVGGGLYVKPYLYNDIFAPPLTDTLGVGVNGGLHFTVGILGWNLIDYDYTLLDYRKPIYVWAGPTNNPPNTPGAPSGPTAGSVGTTYFFTVKTTDPDGDRVNYQCDWGDGRISGWSFYVSSGDSVLMTHSYSSVGTYQIKAKAKDKQNAESNWSAGHSITIGGNNPPKTPSTPSGPSSGSVGTSYSFSSSVSDPDGDSVAIQFDWGDGTTSSWSAFVSSGSSGSMSHSYSTAGTYQIIAKAKDTKGAESGWSTKHSISITAGGEGTPKWRYQTGGSVNSPAIGPDRTVYVVSGDGYSYAINSDGTFKWRYQTGGYEESSPVIGSDGTIYVMSDYLYAINSDGTLKWRYQTGVYAGSSPAIGLDGTIYIGVTDTSYFNYYLYAINSDGTFKWRYQTVNWVNSSPAIGSDGTIYVVSDYLYAINSNGTLKWCYETGYHSLSSSPAIGSDGTIYVVSDYLYAFDPNGSLKWRYSPSDWALFSPAIGSDGTVYLGSDDRYLYAVNPNGTLKWRYQTGGFFRSVPAIGSDGTVYAGAVCTFPSPEDGILYAINSDGSLKWQCQTGNYIVASPAIGSDGTVYVGNNGNYLYAIQGSGMLANSPWPMFHHDLTHSGRVGGP